MRVRGELRRGRIVAITAAVGAIVIGGGWLRRQGGEKAETGSQEGASRVVEELGGPLATGMAIPIEADTVRRGTLVLRVTATGQTEAERRATIAAQQPGQVVAVAVRESDLVGRGDALLRLDPSEATLVVERAGAALGEARARYRELTLFDERIDDVEIRRERAEAIRARSGLSQAEVALREAELALARSTIRAPFAGRVADVRVTAGEHVGAGEDLLTLLDLDPIRVEVQVVESELRWLRAGGGAAVRLVAFPDTIYRGRIVTISPVVDPATRTSRVTVLVPNPGSKILPGMYARVALEGRSLEGRLLVPREAVLEREGRTLVFLFEPLSGGPAGEGHAKWVYVTTGEAGGGLVEIVEGEGTEVLEPGAIVLTGGHVTLVHDARVRIGVGADRAP